MNFNKRIHLLALAMVLCAYEACKTPSLVQSPNVKNAPGSYAQPGDTSSSATIRWREFFKDPYLISLIDTALQNNQELAIALQEVEIARNEIRIRKGQLLPKAEAGLGAGMEKVGRYTSQGAGDASTDITPGREVPEWLPDYRAGIFASWEADIWKKLRNARQAAVTRYLSTAEGRNFVITNLIAEIAHDYYELLALDNELEIVRQTITLQKNALEVVRIQKQAAAATELAVKKFEAEVLSSQNLEYDILQKIQAKENTLNFLLGRYPTSIARDTTLFLKQVPWHVSAGLPSQLLKNRPDIRQAELDLSAARLDLKIARVEFYPSFNITGAIGFQAFNPAYLIKFPESLLSTVAGDLAGPLINKHAIKAEYSNANSRQIQALYQYERSILNAFVEVSTEISNLDKFDKMYETKAKEVDVLNASVDISGELFRSARADYLEVLLTQRDALEAKMELVETKLNQFNTITNMYRALGGGWN
jgi:NodT family efflux transporter outer membrane factor (OMF) lipoprotein